jgi:IS1 family transposase
LAMKLRPKHIDAIKWFEIHELLVQFYLSTMLQVTCHFQTSCNKKPSSKIITNKKCGYQFKIEKLHFQLSKRNTTKVTSISLSIRRHLHHFERVIYFHFLHFAS